jgi:hypothetical protein
MKTKNTLQPLPKWQLLLLLFFIGLFSGQAQQLQSMLMEDWNNEAWHDQGYTQFDYDGNGFLSHTLISVWYSPPDDFVLQGRETNTNNPQGLPVETINEGLDLETGEWFVGTRYQNTYDESGKLLLHEFASFENGVWSAISQEIHEYNSDNKETAATLQQWNLNINNWQNLTRYLYTYNDEGLMATSLFQQWNSLNSVWFDLGLETYTYNENGKLILSQVGDVETSGGRNLYTYNASNELIQHVNQQSANGIWINIMQELFSYNPDGTLAQEIRQHVTNEGSWVNHKRITYNYTGLGVPHFNERQLVVYPNPSRDHIIIKGGVEGTDYSISDAMGRMVASGELHETDELINVEQLTAGIYLIKAGDSTIKIIKE